MKLGGDADTIAAMTGAIAGASYGVESISEEWRDGVEEKENIERSAHELWIVKSSR